jgi:hypothetical protein
MFAVFVIEMKCLGELFELGRTCPDSSRTFKVT